MDEIAELQSLGLTLPSPAYLIGAILFGCVGIAAYRIGKKSSRPATKWLGVALMFFPYVVSETWMLYTVGAALCAAAYYYRR
jgi:tryptophan-rich sensory protein